MQVKLPPELQVDAALVVKLLYEGGADQAALGRLQDWIMDKGWSEVAEGWVDMLALDIQNIALQNFHDEQVVNHWMLEEVGIEEITDDDRTAWGVHVIEEVYASSDSELAPSVHTVDLSDVDGRVAFLGFLVRGEGYDQMFEWFGLFKSAQDFYDLLARDRGYIVSNGEDPVDHSLILRLWGLTKGGDLF